jgi:hypothetical protein
LNIDTDDNQTHNRDNSSIRHTTTIYTPQPKDRHNKYETFINMDHKSDHEVLRGKVSLGAGGGEWCPLRVDSAGGGEGCPLTTVGMRDS